jgi:hypothetical protein
MLKTILKALSALFVPQFRLWATQESTQFAQASATPPTMVPVYNWHGRLRLYWFTHETSAGADGDTIALIQLPAGSVRMILPLSRLFFDAFGAARTLDLGWEAYTDLDGAAVAADPNGLDDGIDVSSSGSVVPGGTVGEDETKLFQSQGGVVITGQINDAAITASLTLSGYFAVVVD